MNLPKNNNKLMAGRGQKVSIFYCLFIVIFSIFSCSKNSITQITSSKNLIIVVIDGARYSETWGEPNRKYIPLMAGQMAKFGVVYTHFYNNGVTSTIPGHTSITTGIYQIIDDFGTEWPKFPSIFQYLNLKYNHDTTSTLIIASKGKLAVLAKCKDQPEMNMYSPSVDCGIDGLGSSRDDSITFKVVQKILLEQHPNLVLIQFREPDFSGHTGNWEAYLKGISSSDEYVFHIWKLLQSDKFYKGKTTLMVTNDHGRHLDSIADGFISHGDTCEGCRHISFFACGPDIKQGQIIETKRELIDIPVTVAQILGLHLENVNGKVMTEIFNEPDKK
jgi:hypothetical protein